MNYKEIMSKKDLELYLYKNKLNDLPLNTILEKLSSKTIKNILEDLTKDNIKLEKKDNIIYVFTDGNCKNNGRKNAKAGYCVFFTEEEDSIYYTLNKSGMILNEPTNQKAELTAMLQLFCIIDENIKLFKNKTINICSDSLYTIKCITEWYKNWEKNGYKTSKNENVKNSELIKQIIELKEEVQNNNITINFKHVFSHTMEPQSKDTVEYYIWKGNKICDELVNEIINH
jgi:ribonuclease HI